MSELDDSSEEVFKSDEILSSGSPFSGELSPDEIMKGYDSSDSNKKTLKKPVNSGLFEEDDSDLPDNAKSKDPFKEDGSIPSLDPLSISADQLPRKVEVPKPNAHLFEYGDEDDSSDELEVESAKPFIGGID